MYAPGVYKAMSVSKVSNTDYVVRLYCSDTPVQSKTTVVSFWDSLQCNKFEAFAFVSGNVGSILRRSMCVGSNTFKSFFAIAAPA